MSPSFYFSGVDRADFLSLLAAEQAAAMINARNALQPALRHAYTRRWPSVPLVLDSGAFQGERDVAAYTDLVEQIGARFQWISNLDALWQPAVGERNFAYLQSHLSPALRPKIVWIYQPGGSLGDVEWFAKSRGLIGIGGLVPLLRQQGVEAVLRLLYTIGEHLNRVGGQAHVFGISSPQILFRIRSERWLASVDSSKWLVAFRARELLRKDGTHQTSIDQLGLCFTKHEMAANNIRVMQFWLLPAPIAQLPLFEMEEAEAASTEEAEDLFRERHLSVFLQLELAHEEFESEFLMIFTGYITSWTGGEEDGEVLFDLCVPLFLEEDLDLWCQQAQQKGDTPRRLKTSGFSGARPLKVLPEPGSLFMLGL